VFRILSLLLKAPHCYGRSRAQSGIIRLILTHSTAALTFRKSNIIRAFLLALSLLPYKPLQASTSALMLLGMGHCKPFVCF
jgi:hypothetical protein